MNQPDFQFQDNVDGKEVDVLCFDYGYSPEIGIDGFERIELVDQDGKEVTPSEADLERLHILAAQSFESYCSDVDLD